MELELTTDEIAQIYKAAGDSVTVINAYVSRTQSKETETEWKAMIKRNADHLETIKVYKKVDGSTSIWTTESFTDIDAAITKGKSLYS